MIEQLKHHMTNLLAVENKKYGDYGVLWRVGNFCKWITLESKEDYEEHLKDE